MAEEVSKIVSLVRGGVIRQSYKTVHYLDGAGQQVQTPRDIELSEAELVAHYGAAHAAAQIALNTSEDDLRDARAELAELSGIEEAHQAKIAELLDALMTTRKQVAALRLRQD